MLLQGEKFSRKCRHLLTLAQSVAAVSLKLINLCQNVSNLIFHELL